MSIKIYTKTGDNGTTGLFGGQRVSKSSARIDSYGTVDELNAIVGLALSGEVPARLKTPLREISNLLFTVGADLATPLHPAPKYHIPRVETSHIEYLEKLIDEFEAELPPLKNFILPGGTESAAHLHMARTVCRRAERSVVALAQEEEIGTDTVRFLNRLSDFFFVAARMANFLSEISDIPWEPRGTGK